MAKKTRPPLTNAKSQWAGQFKPSAVKGMALNHNAGVQDRYNKQLQALISQMADQVERTLRKLFESDAAELHFTQDASISSQSRIVMNSLMGTFNSLFAKRAKSIASQMVNGADKSSTSALHGSLKELSGGLSLKTSIAPPALGEALNAALYDNVNLIKTIPGEYLDRVYGAVMRSIQPGGDGLQGLIPQMQEYKQITQRHAKNIALDQTRKAFSNANSLRMQSLGVKKFEWIHSGGGAHPREDHVKMSGNVYSFDDLPVIGVMYGADVRGLPAQLPNCRCTMAPVIEFDDGEAE